VIQPQSFQELAPEPVRPAQEERKGIIIVHSKDVPSEERKVFQFWGRVAVWDTRYVNIPLDKLPPFDYLFIDMRVKEARNALGAMNLSAYRTVCYVPWWHKSESFVDQLEAIALTSFPLRAISKEEFERQLLSEKIQSPSLLRSFLRFAIPCLSAQ
jgi:hypothetical protein